MKVGIDWGCEHSDDDRQRYEECVANAIAEAFRDTEVDVSSDQRSKNLVILTTRDEDGRILTDDATQRDESDIEDSVHEIAHAVWERGDFWSEVQS